MSAAGLGPGDQRLGLSLETAFEKQVPPPSLPRDSALWLVWGSSTARRQQDEVQQSLARDSSNWEGVTELQPQSSSDSKEPGECKSQVGLGGGKSSVRREAGQESRRNVVSEGFPSLQSRPDGHSPGY